MPTLPALAPHLGPAARRPTLLPLWGVGLLAAVLTGCATAPAPKPAQAPEPVSTPPTVAVVPAPVPAPAPESPVTGPISLASSEREYRRDGARHLYDRYAQRIYPGKLPPLLQAVGVMRLHIDARGAVRQIEWMRAPDHVPHVKAEIERLVHAAAPFPAPRQLGSVVYTDTWLWDRSGRFQLDTLSEGQLDRTPARRATAPQPRARNSARPTASRASAAPPTAASGPVTRVAQDGTSP